jgi:hypothetical protein
MEFLIEKTNVLIKYLELAQSKGSFTLAQSSEIYATILSMHKEFDVVKNPKKNPIPPKNINEKTPPNKTIDDK